MPHAPCSVLFPIFAKIFHMHFDFLQIVAAFMVLFAIIDIPGSIPIILDIKAKTGSVNALRATVVSLVIFLAFLIFGEKLLGIFGIDASSFAIAGSFIIFLLGMEMVLGVEFFKHDSPGGGTIVPIAFPLIAGAGSITTILSLRAEYDTVNILVALLLNMVIVYIVLRLTSAIEKLLGRTGLHILKKFFGIILIAIAIRLFLNNTGITLPNG
jgi:multiple antibiotic resistance protein